MNIFSFIGTICESSSRCSFFVFVIFVSVQLQDVIVHWVTWNMHQGVRMPVYLILAIVISFSMEVVTLSKKLIRPLLTIWPVTPLSMLASIGGVVIDYYRGIKLYVECLVTYTTHYSSVLNFVFIFIDPHFVSLWLTVI